MFSNKAAASALSLLVLQNSTSILLQHRVQSRDRGSENGHDPLTAIILSELIKLTLSTLLIVKNNTVAPKCSAASLQASTRGILTGHHEAAVPAALYTLATFLQSLGAYNLDLLSYLVLSQAKIIITPIFSVLILNQNFTRAHWFCFILMTVGIILVQMASTKAPDSTHQTSTKSPDHILGTIYMLMSGCCVALAAVRVEKMLQTPRAFMYRNAHLAGYSLLSACSIYLWRTPFGFTDFFGGYNLLVWGFIGLQATGGFLVAWCVSLTSTVTKNNAQVLGFLLASMAPLLMQGVASPQLLCGVLLAVGAVLGSAHASESRKAPIVEKGHPTV